MLKDRRVLLEHDLKIAHDRAAEMYLDIVVTDGDVHSEEYQQMRDRISKLEFDLNVVNQLIHKGHA
jgi:uncharacterized tellurite resistance protein B-like protein